MVILTYIKITDTGRWHKNYWIVIPIRAESTRIHRKSKRPEGTRAYPLVAAKNENSMENSGWHKPRASSSTRSRVREGVPPGLPPLLGCAAWDPRRARVRWSSWAGGMRHLKSRRRRRRRIEPRIAVWAAC